MKRFGPVLLLLVAASKGHAPATATVVPLTVQTGSALDATARTLVADDLAQAKGAGDTPLLLVGSAKLSTSPGPEALFAQVQSASFCGSAGCSTTVFVKHGSKWVRVLDSVSGQIRVSQHTHRGMHDLLVHGRDRFVWTGKAYADTLPTPKVDLKD